MDARLRFFPVAGGGFGSWDRMTGASAPLRFEPAGDASPQRLSLGEGERTVTAQRR